MSCPIERELLRERLIAENEQLRSHYRARLAEVEDAMAAAIAVDLGDAADSLRPRLAAAAVMAALTVAKEHARCISGARPPTPRRRRDRRGASCSSRAASTPISSRTPGA